MGLDITAYRGLTKVENAELDSDENPIAWGTRFRTTHLDSFEKDFPGRSEGLERNATYAFEEKFGFRAGSYGGYNQWRDELAELAGYKSAKNYWENHQSGPFWELINFYDNEGIIGPIVAEKLAKDFAAFRDAAETREVWFVESYRDWEKAFVMAANNGAVAFH